MCSAIVNLFFVNGGEDGRILLSFYGVYYTTPGQKVNRVRGTKIIQNTVAFAPFFDIICLYNRIATTVYRIWR